MQLQVNSRRFEVFEISRAPPPQTNDEVSIFNCLQSIQSYRVIGESHSSRSDDSFGASLDISLRNKLKSSKIRAHSSARAAKLSWQSFNSN